MFTFSICTVDILPVPGLPVLIFYFAHLITYSHARGVPRITSTAYIVLQEYQRLKLLKQAPEKILFGLPEILELPYQMLKM